MRLIDADAILDYAFHSKLKIYDDVKEIVDEMPTIDAVPVGCLELEKRDASFADACDMGSAYSRERERACKNIIEWWESPSYERCLEVATQRGFVQKKWK